MHIIITAAAAEIPVGNDYKDRRGGGGGGNDGVSRVAASRRV